MPLLRTLVSTLALTLLAMACTDSDPDEGRPAPSTTPSAAMSTPPITGAVVSILMEQPDVLYEGSWSGEVDIAEISEALIAAGVTALVRAGDLDAAGNVDNVSVEILRSPSTGVITTVVSTTSDPQGILTVSSTAETDQPLCRRGPNSTGKRILLRISDACFDRNGNERSIWWIEDGLWLSATSLSNKRTMIDGLRDWHVLPYACREPEPVGDLDGDGKLDEIQLLRPSLGVAVVCTSSGGVFAIPEVPPNSGLFDAVDIDGDGLFEILTGGTSAFASYQTFSRFDDGELREFGAYTVGSHWRVRCVDLDGDGLLEIMQGEIDTDSQTWEVTTSRVEDDRYTVIDQRSGGLSSGPDVEYPSIPSEGQISELRAELGFSESTDQWKNGCPTS